MTMSKLTNNYPDGGRSLREEGFTRRDFFSRTVGAAAGSFATALSLSSIGGGIARAAQQGSLFEQLKAEAFRAWEEHRFADAEVLFTRAAQEGDLGETELRFLSVIKRSYMDRPEEALPIAEFNFRKYPCARSVMELIESYGDVYDFNRARDLLARVCGVGNSATPEETLLAIEQKAADFGPGDGDGLKGIAFRIGTKHYQLTYTLSLDLVVDRVRADLAKTNCHTFYIYPDCPDQKISYQVIDAQKTEETVDKAGNRILRILRQPGIDPKVEMSIVHEGMTFDIRTSEDRRDQIPEDIECYLGKTTRIDPRGPRAQAVASEVIAATRYETLKNINEWWKRHVQMGPIQSKGTLGESEVMLEEGRGYCWEQSRGLIAVLRACNIPARQVAVLVVGPRQGDYRDPGLGIHITTEFYDPAFGWILWEIGKPELWEPPKKIGESMAGYIRFWAECPDNEDQIGNIERQFYRVFYGGGPEGNDLVNTGRSLTGLSLSV